MRPLFRFFLASAVVIINFLVLTSATLGDISVAPYNVHQYWRNTNVLRTIDLTSPIARETTAFVSQNVHKEPVGEYYFPVKEDLDEHLAWIEAKERKTNTVFEVEKAEFDSLNRIQYYKIFFDHRVDPEEKITFVIKTAYTHILTPLPHEIAQTGKQYLLYKGNQYASSAYFTDKQKTEVKLLSGTLLDYTKNSKAVHSGNTITYGPFSNTKPNTHETLTAHYAFQKPILTVTDLRRDLELSHWGGNLAVEEHFNLRHDGAKLKGQFSRLEFQTSSVHGHHDSIMIQDFTLHFPVHASDVYFRDEVGNVSTSNFRNERHKSVLEFKPRYPLYGGWNYTWYHGYNVPLGDFVRFHPESGRYILNVPFISAFTQTNYDKVEVRVILPEGAKDVKVEIPFSVDREMHGVHKTYLDTTGRYLVVLKKYNVADEHIKQFQVSYVYHNHDLLRKPLAVSAFFFAGFLLSMIYARMEFKIAVKKLQ